MNEKLLKLIAEETGHEPATITADTKIMNLVEDSLEFLCLITAVKQAFGHIPNSVVTSINTVGDLERALP